MACVNNTTAISLEGNLGLSEDDGMIGYVTDLKNMDIQLGMTAIWPSSHSYAVLWKWMSMLAILIYSFSFSVFDFPHFVVSFLYYLLPLHSSLQCGLHIVILNSCSLEQISESQRTASVTNCKIKSLYFIIIILCAYTYTHTL